MQASSRIIHHVPTTDALDLHELRFASRYISDEVAATVAEARIQKLNEFFRDLTLKFRDQCKTPSLKVWQYDREGKGGAF